MFYSQYILARKGPLGKIWLAAHFEKKLTKSQVFATDITESVQTIVNPTVPLALRVSGHLMLGIVRIYSDKVRYLSADCRDAMTRINLAFRVQSSRVDIDEVVSGKIDDANYALLPMEDDEQSAQIAYQRKVVRSLPKLDESDVTSFFAVGEIELLRHDISRPSILSRRSSAVPDSSRRSVDRSQKMDEDILPAFDAQIGENLFGDSQFEMYEPFELPVEPTYTTQNISPSHNVEPQGESEHLNIVPVETSAIRVKSTKAKRRKVEINDQVEIPDKQWKQRLVDVHGIVRTQRNLTFEEDRGPKIDIFEDVTGSLQYCPELNNLVGLFSGRNVENLSFLRREETMIPSMEDAIQPEIVRRQSGLETSTADFESVQERSLASRRSMDVSMNNRESFAPDISQDNFVPYDYGMEENLNMSTHEKSFEGMSVAAQKSIIQKEATQLVTVSEEQKSERTKAVFSIVEKELQRKGEEGESIQVFCGGCSKAVAARFFLELLQLKTWGKIELTQENSYDPIMVHLA